MRRMCRRLGVDGSLHGQDGEGSAAGPFRRPSKGWGPCRGRAGPATVGAEKIGRASCRERGEVGAVAGSLQRTSEGWGPCCGRGGPAKGGAVRLEARQSWERGVDEGAAGTYD